MDAFKKLLPTVIDIYGNKSWIKGIVCLQKLNVYLCEPDELRGVVVLCHQCMAQLLQCCDLLPLSLERRRKAIVFLYQTVHAWQRVLSITAKLKKVKVPSLTTLYTNKGCQRWGNWVWTTCLESLRSYALAGDRTRDLLIASPTPYRCATTPPVRSKTLV